MVIAPNIVVRGFEAADAEEVAALIRATLLTSNAADYPLAELESLADWYSADGLLSRLGHARRIVAVDPTTQAIVGTAARRENRLEAFFVAADWQGRRVGAQLLAALEDDARCDALRVVWLESSLTAVGFYTSQGYVAAGGPQDFGDGVVVPMRKRIVPAKP